MAGLKVDNDMKKIKPFGYRTQTWCTYTSYYAEEKKKLKHTHIHQDTNNQRHLSLR